MHAGPKDTNGVEHVTQDSKQEHSIIYYCEGLYKKEKVLALT